MKRMPGSKNLLFPQFDDNLINFYDESMVQINVMAVGFSFDDVYPLTSSLKNKSYNMLVVK